MLSSSSSLLDIVRAKCTLSKFASLPKKRLTLTSNTGSLSLWHSLKPEKNPGAVDSAAVVTQSINRTAALYELKLQPSLMSVVTVQWLVINFPHTKNIMTIKIVQPLLKLQKKLKNGDTAQVTAHRCHLGDLTQY